MTRALVVIAFFLLSVAIIVYAFDAGVTTETGTLLVNLGTEVFGILITLAVVDWLLERRRLQDRAREMAWSTLHAVERAVWLWQGGPRRLETDELLSLIAGIEADHPLLPSTRTLLVSLGVESGEALKREAGAVKTLPGLEDALEDLTSLQTLGERDSAVSIRMVAEVLESTATRLARILGQPTQRLPSGLIRDRDPRAEAQERRLDRMQPRTDRTAPGPPEGEAGGLRPDGSAA